MKFLQGTIKRVVNEGGGKRRLLLERKDGTEFVATVLPDTSVNGIGTLLKAGGFEAREAHMGRDVYEQVAPSEPVTVLDMSNQETAECDVDTCSIELAALINLSSQLLKQSPDKVLEDVIKVYKEL
jgi:hypothetical protein